MKSAGRGLRGRFLSYILTEAHLELPYTRRALLYCSCTVRVLSVREDTDVKRCFQKGRVRAVWLGCCGWVALAPASIK